MKQWIVSQEALGAGKWIVSNPGPNRPNKIARFDNKAEAEHLAERLNTIYETNVIKWCFRTRASFKGSGRS